MPNDYRAYLIRFQRQPGVESWRASLENVHSREVLHFVTERALLVYLLQELSEQGALPAAESNVEADGWAGTARLEEALLRKT